MQPLKVQNLKYKIFIKFIIRSDHVNLNMQPLKSARADEIKHVTILEE